MSSSIYDLPVSDQSRQWPPPPPPPPYYPWTGEDGPNGPGGPIGYGGGDNGGGRNTRRLRRMVLIVAVALVAGLGTFFSLQSTGSQPTRALTTSQITAMTDPGLVDVVSTLGYENAESAGTGLVLTPNGEILTNNHVIEGATSIKVTDIGNGRTYTAKVVGYDQTKDIAVIQLENASGLKTVNLGDSSSAAVGQGVTAIGNAGGKGGTPSVVTGRITGLNASITASDEGSGTSEQLTGMINDDADIQPGDSGGPLVSSSGQVIGIDTAASSQTGFQIQSGQSQADAFAIPINQALSLARQIEAGHGSTTVHIGTTAFLGVEVVSSSQAQNQGQSGSGALLEGVLSGSAAQSAGLAQGDLITSVNGTSVTSPATLQSAMEKYHPGDTVKIGWTDESGQSHSASVHLASGPAQ